MRTITTHTSTCQQIENLLFQLQRENSFISKIASYQSKNDIVSPSIHHNDPVYKDNYVQAPNFLYRSSHSLKSRELTILAHLKSNKPGWITSTAVLASRLNESYDAIRLSVDRLVNVGLVARKKIRDKKGRFFRFDIIVNRKLLAQLNDLHTLGIETVVRNDLRFDPDLNCTYDLRTNSIYDPFLTKPPDPPGNPEGPEIKNPDFFKAPSIWDYTPNGHSINNNTISNIDHNLDIKTSHRELNCGMEAETMEDFDKDFLNLMIKRYGLKLVQSQIEKIKGYNPHNREAYLQIMCKRAENMSQKQTEKPISEQKIKSGPIVPGKNQMVEKWLSFNDETREKFFNKCFDEWFIFPSLCARLNVNSYRSLKEIQPDVYDHLIDTMLDYLKGFRYPEFEAQMHWMF
jgi:hypothetical protein